MDTTKKKLYTTICATCHANGGGIQHEHEALFDGYNKHN